jgi:hypoxanthine phosphoribosyltransferase
MSDLAAEIADVRARAQCMYTRAEVDAAFDRMAADISTALSGSNPLLLAVLVGGMYPVVQLAMRLSFPYQLDSAHVTRYRGQLTGGDVEWRSQPRLPVAGRVVLVVDDILDEGVTLAQVMRECTRLGATRVLSAVLARKRHPRPTIGRADYHGLEVGDRYVFGCGMDYKEYFRGLPEIYAVASS